jgi:hypothetical protein
MLMRLREHIVFGAQGLVEVDSNAVKQFERAGGFIAMAEQLGRYVADRELVDCVLALLLGLNTRVSVIGREEVSVWRDVRVDEDKKSTLRDGRVRLDVIDEVHCL